jgi:hypothetical protein
MVLTVAIPGLEIKAAVIVAVKAVTLLLASSVTFVIQEAVEAPELVLMGQVLPFHCTLVCGTKPPPLSVKVKPEQDGDVQAGI